MTGFIRKATGAKQAAQAAERAAGTQADYLRESRDYLMERERLPTELREGALGQYGALFGIGEGDPQKALEKLQASPLYQETLGATLAGREAGEEALLRQASATGGLRGGTSQQAVASFNQGLEEQARLRAMQAGLGGLQGLAALPSNANQIAAMTGGIGETLAQGQTAAANIRQEGSAGAFDLLGPLAGQFAGGVAKGLGLTGGLGGLGAKLGGGLAAMFSDVALKKNILYQSGTNHPEIFKYQWDWIDGSGSDSGYLAQEVEKVYPDLVVDVGGLKMLFKDELEQRLLEAA